MPLASKKHKVSARTTTIPGRVTQQRGIQAFGKITKAQVDRSKQGKSKSVEEPQSSKLDIHPAKTGEKRKRDLCSQSLDREYCNDQSKIPPKSQETQYRCIASRSDDGSPSLPTLPRNTPRKKTKICSIITDTPTKGARTVLESFTFQPSSSSARSSSPPPSEVDTPPTSPSCPRSPVESDELPCELLDLIDLYSSFLTALSLHYAHNGSSAPVDLQELCPSVARAWRRRAVFHKDIQRILAMAQQRTCSKTGLLSLVDYGQGKICIEIKDNSTHRSVHKRLIKEEALNDIFRLRIEQQWSSYIGSKSAPQPVQDFISKLPLLPIGTCTALERLNPLLAKGQRRLEDLKAGAIRAQQSSQCSKIPSAKCQSGTRPKLLASRSDSLLSRIRAKELVQSTLTTPPPSTAMLERKACLRRLEEVAPVIELLTSSTVDRSQQKKKPLGDPQLQAQIQSFTMPTVTQHLQMSLRNPISKDDAFGCIRLLAEIVPEWIGIRVLGKCTSVTIRRGCAPGMVKLNNSVKQMLAKL